MKYLLIFFITLPMLLFYNQSSQSDDIEELETLLHWFLDNAADYDTHNRFWAEDLIYTSSAGDRIGKSDILSGLRHDNQNSENDTIYSGDQIQIRLYGDSDIAVIAFRLIAELPSESVSQSTDRMTFYNTGTFVKQDGEWRAVAWQATQIPGSP